MLELHLGKIVDVEYELYVDNIGSKNRIFREKSLASAIVRYERLLGDFDTVHLVRVCRTAYLPR